MDMAVDKQDQHASTAESIAFIGAGMMRTGTRSLQAALEKIYSGPCYHTFDSMQNSPQDLKFWVESLEDMERGVLRTDRAYWDRLLHGYHGLTDFPGSVFFKELMQAYPNAKCLPLWGCWWDKGRIRPVTRSASVPLPLYTLDCNQEDNEPVAPRLGLRNSNQQVILTTRDPDAWVESVRATVFPLNFYTIQGGCLDFVIWLKGITGILQIVDKGMRLSLRRNRDELMNDTQLRQAFIEWTEYVKKTVPPERLLIFNANEGWTPLCRFLNQPVPDCPFPRVNCRKEMRRYMRFDKPLILSLKYIVPVALCAWLCYVAVRRITGKGF